jgi:Flp pilus assembly secretin CpaC
MLAWVAAFLPGGLRSESQVNRVVDLSLQDSADKTQLVVSADGPARFKPSRLKGGKVIRLSLLDSTLAWTMPAEGLASGVVEKVEARQAQRSGEPVVVVEVTLKQPLAFTLNRDQNQVVLSVEHPAAQSEGEAKKGSLDMPLSLDVQNADLVGTLNALAQQAGFETFFGPAMQALVPPASLVTLRVEQQPFSRILNDLLATLKPPMTYDLQGNVLYFGLQSDITAAKANLPRQTKYFLAKNYDRDVFHSKLTAEMGAAEPILAASVVVANDPDPSSQALMFEATREDMDKLTAFAKKVDAEAGTGEESAVQETHIFRLRYVDPSALQDAVTQVMTPPGPGGVLQGVIKTDPRTRSFIITATPKYLAKVQEILDRLDIQLPQVSIEAKIVEVSLDDVNQLGITWSANPAGAGNPQVSANVSAPVGGVGFLNVTTLQNNTNISAQIQALATKSKANILSSPKIMAQDNQQATIQTQDTIYYQNTVTSVGPNGQPLINTTFVPLPVPITLAVTPQINEENRDIRMNVNFTVSSAPAQTGSAPPAVSQQTATTNVKVKNGETAVIGGLIRNRRTENDQKVPFLGDIPLLGLLFKSHSVVESKSELIILLTPTIVED